jgi:ankyrin repeat protein
MTALTWASFYGHIEAAKLLLLVNEDMNESVSAILINYIIRVTLVIIVVVACSNCSKFGRSDETYGNCRNDPIYHRCEGK